MDVFQCLYNLSGGNFGALNRAAITLLPKRNAPTLVTDFRPISLIHSVAKLISKVLAIRLARQMDGLISVAQSAFIKKRCIQDNFLYVRNMLRNLNASKKPTLFFKLDIARAFDSVSWEYLLELMQNMGFGPRWRNWICLLFSTATSKVVLNGDQGECIAHRRGLRQGDPISPYLFILAIDPLQRLLHLATEGGQLTNIGSRHARLRTSLYADDAAVFLNPVQSEVDVLITMLRDFGKATGLHVNLGKSLVAPIRCQEVDLDDVLRSFSGARASFPLTYLGLPLTPGRLRKVHFQPLQDKIKGRLSGWKPSLLYMGGAPNYGELSSKCHPNLHPHGAETAETISSRN